MNTYTKFTKTNTPLSINTDFMEPTSRFNILIEICQVKAH